MTLRDTILFDEAEFPELAAIFDAIDVGIAALLAADLANRKAPVRRRQSVRTKKARANESLRPAKAAA